MNQGINEKKVQKFKQAHNIVYKNFKMCLTGAHMLLNLCYGNVKHKLYKKKTMFMCGENAIDISSVNRVIIFLLNRFG